MTEALPSSASATIHLADQHVGWLDYFEGEEAYRLEFAPSYLDDPDRHVLGQQFEDHLPRPIETMGLPLWFQWLLPQGPLRGFLQRRHGLEAQDEWSLLLKLGQNLSGAVTVTPCPPRQTAREPARPPPGRHPPTDGLKPKHSLTGFQWKFTISDEGKGLVIPVGGRAGEWIAKFHDPAHPDLPTLEAGISAWASAAGLTVPDTRLAHVDEFVELPADVPTGDGTVFLSRRFDRQPLAHMEDFAQILGRADQRRGTSEELGSFVHALCPEDERELVRRLIFCVLCGNGDAHLKNWSLSYPDGRTARLSPAYDIVSTIVYPQFRDDDLTLPLGGHRAFGAIDLTSFDALARLFERTPDEVGGWVSDAATTIRRVWANGKPFGLTDDHAHHIDAHLATLKL